MFRNGITAQTITKAVRARIVLRDGNSGKSNKGKAAIIVKMANWLSDRFISAPGNVSPTFGFGSLQCDEQISCLLYGFRRQGKDYSDEQNCVKPYEKKHAEKTEKNQKKTTPECRFNGFVRNH
ncbi:hypothetical protein [Duffyella gerundensis]|uniref:hypothetical protein n=1 Tax=Duffyella gerundensis TaxID=1619313 RepID=UPI00223B5EF4|nr:hypothetical protein [Duffyella gerundensis]